MLGLNYPNTKILKTIEHWGRWDGDFKHLDEKLKKYRIMGIAFYLMLFVWFVLTFFH